MHNNSINFSFISRNKYSTHSLCRPPFRCGILIKSGKHVSDPRRHPKFVDFHLVSPSFPFLRLTKSQLSLSKVKFEKTLSQKNDLPKNRLFRSRLRRVHWSDRKRTTGHCAEIDCRNVAVDIASYYLVTHRYYVDAIV